MRRCLKGAGLSDVQEQTVQVISYPAVAFIDEVIGVTQGDIAMSSAVARDV